MSSSYLANKRGREGEREIERGQISSCIIDCANSLRGALEAQCFIIPGTAQREGTPGLLRTNLNELVRTAEQHTHLMSSALLSSSPSKLTLFFFSGIMICGKNRILKGIFWRVP